MIRFLLALVLVAARASAADDPVTELHRLTEQRFAANAANDRGFYERLLAPNFLMFDATGEARTKQEYLDSEFQPRPTAHKGARATIADFRALVAADSAAVTYRAVEPTPLGGQTFEARSRRLDTYVRVKGAWQLVAMASLEVASWPDVAAVDPKLYAEYAGTYALSPQMMVVVTNEGGHLMAQVTGQPKVELFPENATTFFDRTDSPLARTIFERDASGRVVAQVYRAQGQKLRATRVR